VANILAEGLTRLGFTKTTDFVAGYPKDYWFKDGYWFASRGVGKYGIIRNGVEGREKIFSTRKRKPYLADAEILAQLEKWLENPQF
jgi:hypothetical protein